MAHAEELQKLWDAGLKAAVENRRAGKENAAYTGDVRYAVEKEEGEASTSSETTMMMQVTIDSTDEQRYEILKNKEIHVAEPYADFLDTDDIKKLSSYDRMRASGELRGKDLTILQDAMRKLATKLGINNIDLRNSSLSFPFKFSNRNVGKSTNHQKQYSGSYADLAKALSCIKGLVDGAELIETHREKKTGTIRENKDLKQTYVLLGAMRDGQRIVPIEMVVKEFYTSDAGLYMTVTLENVKDSGVVEKASAGKAAGTQSLVPKSVISIQDLIREVNPFDSRLLKYFPDQMLDVDQIRYKKQALERQDRDYDALRRNDSDTKNSVSVSVSDRSLLPEAAERPGAGEELRRFAKRVKDLEGLQRRLERQEKKLAALREEGERRADEGIGPYEGNGGRIATATKGGLAMTGERVDEGIGSYGGMRADEGIGPYGGMEDGLPRPPKAASQ